jgi:hypothetical protein
MLENKGNRIIYSGMVYTMHCPIHKKRYIPMTGKGVVLLKKIKIEPLEPRLKINGGAILSNRIVGITSTPVQAPPSNTMASIGGSINFSKHVKPASRSVMKEADKEERIKFVF